jgi:hypothetical protein
MPALLSAGSGPSRRARSPTRFLDLDDLGAEEHQLVAAVRARQYVGQVEDPYAVQRSVVHASPLGRYWRGFMSP